MNPIFKSLFFIAFFWEISFAEMGSEPFGFETQTNVAEDSVEIYYDLIAEEHRNAHYSGNIVGMVTGGILTGIGTAIFVKGYQELDQSKKDTSWFGGLAAGLFTGLSFPFLIVGLPVFVVNTCLFFVHKRHASRRDAYRDALKRYRERKENSKTEALEWGVVPFVNLADAGGGMNFVVAF